MSGGAVSAAAVVGLCDRHGGVNPSAAAQAQASPPGAGVTTQV